MLIDSVYIAGTGAHLPGIEALPDTVPQERRDSLQQVSAAVSADLAGPQLAASAAEVALRRGRTSPADVGLHLHATMYDQGLSIWSASAYVARQVGLDDTCSLEVRQCSNGGMGALQLAACQLTADTGAGSALVTTGDHFDSRELDRWELDPGLIMGDAGGAVVLARDGGCARIVSLGWSADNGLEPVQRGDEPLALDRDTARVPISLLKRTNEYLGERPRSELRKQLDERQRQAVEAAFDQTGWTLDDIDHVVAPNYGRTLLNKQCLAPLGIPEEKTLWASFGRYVAHVGSGDHLIGLDRLLTAGIALPGDRVMLHSVGGGFAWTVALLEILDLPEWSAAVPAGGGTRPGSARRANPAASVALAEPAAPAAPSALREADSRGTTTVSGSPVTATPRTDPATTRSPLDGLSRNGTPLQLDGKVAVVTGGTKGLGAAIRDFYLAAGATVVAASRNPKNDAAWSSERSVVLPADVTDPASVAELFDETAKRFGGIDILVANAGVVWNGRLERLGLSQWKDMVDINLTGLFICTQGVVPYLERRGGGSIVTMSSCLASRPAVGASGYVATKAAIEAFTRAAALELAGTGIRVNCLAPGFLDVGMGDVIRRNERVWAAYEPSLIAGHMGTGADVAAAAAFLCSDAATYVNGHVLEVNGGLRWY
jgi:3-oxoacyl-[acyl-carrier protein] reductase